MQLLIYKIETYIIEGRKMQELEAYLDRGLLIMGGVLSIGLIFILVQMIRCMIEGV